jgi:hypothetical protein
MGSSPPTRAVLEGLRDSLNRQGRLYGHPVVRDFDAIRAVIAVLRGEGSGGLTPDEVRIVLDTDYRFSQLTEDDAVLVGELRELGSIALSASPLGAAGMQALASLPRLARLEVGNANLKRTAYPTIAAVTGLRSFGISGDKKFGDADIDALLGLGRLETVRLRDTGLTDAGIAKLAAVPSIVDVELPSGVTDAGVAAIAAKGAAGAGSPDPRKDHRRLAFVAVGVQATTGARRVAVLEGDRRGRAHAVGVRGARGA